MLSIEYIDVFKALSKLVARAVDHMINLIDPITPQPYLQLYKISKDELISIKHTISDYMAKVGLN